LIQKKKYLQKENKYDEEELHSSPKKKRIFQFGWEIPGFLVTE